MKTPYIWMVIAHIKARRELAAAALTPRQAHCLALYYFDGLREGEIGSRFGVTQPAVSQCLTRARRRLAKVGLVVRRLDDDEDRGAVGTLSAHKLDQLGPDEIRAWW